MNGTMTAAVLHGKEDLRIEQVPIPKLQAGELLIKVGAALTCGTDLKVYRRGYHARMLKPPALFGHEVAGEVSEVDSGVKKFAKGMRVVAANSACCGACFYCLHGQENLCDDLLFNNGAYAQYIRIPQRIVEKNLLAIPSHLSFAAAALVEPGLRAAGTRPKRRQAGRYSRDHRRRAHRINVRAGCENQKMSRHQHRQARAAGADGQALWRG